MAIVAIVSIAYSFLEPFDEPLCDSALLGIGFAELTVLWPLGDLTGKAGKGLAGFAQAVVLAGRASLVHAQPCHGTGEIRHLTGIVVILLKHAVDGLPLLLIGHQPSPLLVLGIEQLAEDVCGVAFTGRG